MWVDVCPSMLSLDGSVRHTGPVLVFMWVKSSASSGPCYTDENDPELDPHSVSVPTVTVDKNKMNPSKLTSMCSIVCF